MREPAMSINTVIYGIVVLIGAFGVIGIYLVVRTLRAESARRGESRGAGGPVSRFRAYIGSSKDAKPLLTAPLRVALEFFLALCGFPGIGWMASGRLAPGLLLVAIVPSTVWAVAPVLAASQGALFRDPFATVRYLPVVAVLSAGGLAAAEIHTLQAARRA
jgi:hypothetical protein